jgi:nucleotide-binding universal stress UspA family protein
MVKPFTKVLVGTDFSDGASRAVERAADVAQRYSAQLHVVHVWALPHVATSLVIDPGLEWHTPVEQTARAQLDALIEQLRANQVEASSSLLSGVAWEQIVESIAVLGADLVVVGTHGRTGFRRALLGSVAERVVRFSLVPVLTIH